MRAILELDGVLVDQVLSLLGLDADADPGNRTYALAEATNTALALLVERLSAPEDDPANALAAAQRRTDDLETRLTSAEAALRIAKAAAPPADLANAERMVLALASTPRDEASRPDSRGVPVSVWRPRMDWASIGSLPDDFPLIDEHISALIDALVANPSLRLYVSDRLLATNERYREIVVAGMTEDVVINADVAGVPYRFRLSSEGTLVIGPMIADPERVV